MAHFAEEKDLDRVNELRKQVMISMWRDVRTYLKQDLEQN